MQTLDRILSVAVDYAWGTPLLILLLGGGTLLTLYSRFLPLSGARHAIEILQGKSSNSKFVSGARIVHEQFGYGKILGVQETGDDLKITVQFPGLGIKRLLQSYAKLKLV